VIAILEFKTFLASKGYPTGKITRAGMSMCKLLYLRAYMVTRRVEIFMSTGME
jgi:hypothetical protein